MSAIQNPKNHSEHVHYVDTHGKHHQALAVTHHYDGSVDLIYLDAEGHSHEANRVLHSMEQDKHSFHWPHEATH